MLTLEAPRTDRVAPRRFSLTDAITKLADTTQCRRRASSFDADATAPPARLGSTQEGGNRFSISDAAGARS